MGLVMDGHKSLSKESTDKETKNQSNENQEKD